MEGTHRMDAVVCGIDPGLGITGYGTVRACGSQSPTVIDAGVCRFDVKASIESRLVAIESDLDAIFSEHTPDIVAVEQLYAHYNHPRTAILMGHARGVILLAAARRGIEVRSYAATQVKRYLTGNGRATKGQVQRAIQTTLGLSEIPEPPDVADALALALCCAADSRKIALTDLRPTEVTG
jgi:crossover junction endodeoxyribonuclease RuvC